MYNKEKCRLMTMERNIAKIQRDIDKRAIQDVDLTPILNKIQDVINTFKPTSLETLTSPMAVSLSNVYLDNAYEDQGVPYVLWKSVTKDVLIPTLMIDFGYSVTYQDEQLVDGTIFGYSVVIQLRKK